LNTKSTNLNQLLRIPFHSIRLKWFMLTLFLIYKKYNFTAFCLLLKTSAFSWVLYTPLSTTPQYKNNLKQSKLQKKLTQSVTVFLSLLISECLCATITFFHPFEEKEAKLVGCNLQKKSFTLK